MASSHPSVPGVAFKDVPGVRGYCVGDDGSLWSRKQRGPGGHLRAKWKRVGGFRRTGGYLGAIMRRGGAKKLVMVHRLILEAFVGPCPDGMECRHLNGVRTDNRLCNLAWGTKEENQADIDRHGTRPRGSKHKRAKLTEADVIVIRTMRARGMIFSEIGAVFGVSGQMIGHIIRGQNWTHVPG